MRRPAAASVLALAISAAQATAIPRDKAVHRLQKYSEANTTSTLQWAKCNGFDDSTVPVDCSSLDVPLDYTDSEPGSRTLRLDLLRAPAPKQPSRGSVLVNFGGPGAEAKNTLLLYAAQLQNATGGEFDLIAFDPRGTGTTMPFSCFDHDPAKLQLMTARHPLDVPDASDVALGALWAGAGAWANAYAGNTNATEAAGLVGTAFVARDLMRVVDALGEDGLLRYWGISYGSTLGATVAAMFPDRMDRVVLDAVVNSHRYYHNSGVDIDQLGQADAAWTSFLEQCVEAGPAKCALASLAPSSATDLAAILQAARESYRDSPIAVGTAVVTYTIVSSLYYIFTRNLNILTPRTDLLLSIAQRNITGLERVAAFADAFAAAIDIVEPLYAIKCGDQYPRYDSVEGVVPDIEYYMTSSRVFGSVAAPVSAVCARWPFSAKERYAGRFEGVRTRGPVLFLHNTYDAATAIGSAYNMSAGFEGSVVVEQVGYGHGTFAQPSACSMEIVRAYFLDGKLPEGNTKCAVDTTLFP